MDGRFSPIQHTQLHRGNQQYRNALIFCKNQLQEEKEKNGRLRLILNIAKTKLRNAGIDINTLPNAAGGRRTRRRRRKKSTKRKRKSRRRMRRKRKRKTRRRRKR